MITSDIEKKLERDEKFDEELIKENLCPELNEFLTACMERAEMSRAELISVLDMDRNYGYQM